MIKRTGSSSSTNRIVSVPPRNLASAGAAAAFCSRRGDGRQEDFEDRALAEAAGDLDPALVLLDDAIDRRQPEPGALANFLGGEERLEYARQMFRRDARARVAYRQTNKLPRPRFAIGLRVRPRPPGPLRS